MNFKDAVVTCLTQKYATFSGRASRSEYWWFALAQFALMVVGAIIGGIVNMPVLVYVFLLPVVIPGIAAGVRRLHDTGKSGWWLLVGLVPFVGGFIQIYFLVQPGTPGDNQFGEPVTA